MDNMVEFIAEIIKYAVKFFVDVGGGLFKWIAFFVFVVCLNLVFQKAFDNRLKANVCFGLTIAIALIVLFALVG